MTSETPPSGSTPRWMRVWLTAAGTYNIACGAAIVIAPIWTLRALGVAPASHDLWPQLWACIGMILGVYGLGCLIAARDPLRHWPVVFVGLLGTILGPIGFLDAAIRGQLPWSMGVTILTNGVLWWIPFSMILWHAARAAQPSPPAGRVTLDTALDGLQDDQGRTLRALTDDRQTLVVLLRHSGCTFCKQTLSDLAKRQADIQNAGVGLAVVGMTASSAGLRLLGERYGVTSAAWFADPDRLLYRALEIGRGSFLQLFGPRVWAGGVLAAARGHRAGKLQGDGFQMPGACIIESGRIVLAYRYTTAADRPDLKEFACRIN